MVESVHSALIAVSPFKATIYFAIDLAVCAVLIHIMRRAWSRNATIPPLERFIFSAAPICLILMGLVMLQDEHPESLIGAIGILIGLFTTLLMARQIGIANHQTAILDRQDALLSQRAMLVVWGAVEYQRQVSNAMQTHMEFGVINLGTRSARTATLQLLMPASFDANAMFGQAYPAWFCSLDVEGTQRWEVDLDRLFFVDVPIVRSTYVAFNHPSEIGDVIPQIRWRIAFEDGIVPGKGLWQPLTTREAMRTPGAESL